MTGPQPGPAEPVPVLQAPLLRLDGFEGPMDLLLELARAQKVDLSRISVLELVEQYLAVLERMRLVRLELAADWLVIAAWLAWLKSRLLLPDDGLALADGEAAADLLQARLLDLARVRQVAAWLQDRPQLGQDVFGRGMEEDLSEIDRSGLTVDLGQLLSAYLVGCRRAARKTAYRPQPIRFWTVADALHRLRRLLGDMPLDWRALERFLPDAPPGPEPAGRHRRAAIAGTLVAGLELARLGTLELHQDEPFGPLLLRGCRQPSTARLDEHEMRQAAE